MCALDHPFHAGPKALKRVDADGTTGPFLLAVVDGVKVVVIAPTQLVPGMCLIGIDPRPRANMLGDVGYDVDRFAALNDPRDDITATFHHAENNGLVIFALLVFAANKGLIDLNSATTRPPSGASPSI